MIDYLNFHQKKLQYRQHNYSKEGQSYELNSIQVLKLYFPCFSFPFIIILNFLKGYVDT